MAKKEEKLVSKLITTDMMEAIQIHIDEIKKLTEKQMESYNHDLIHLKKGKFLDDLLLQTTFEIMETNPQFVPPYIDGLDSKMDFENYLRLDILSSKFKNLSQSFKLAAKKASVSSQTSALAYHKTVKQAAKLQVADAKEILLSLEAFKI